MPRNNAKDSVQYITQGSGTCYRFVKIWAFTKIKSTKGLDQLSGAFP